MKTWIALIGICVAVIMSSGCASTVKTVDPNYQAYQQAKLTQPALVSIKWSEDGQHIKELTVNAPMDIQQKAPDAPHPAWAVVNSLVRAGGIVGGIWAGGEALEGVIEAGRGTTSISGSYNQPGGNMASGDMSIPTTTTNTETITGTEATPE